MRNFKAVVSNELKIALRNGWLHSYRIIFALIAVIIIVLGTVSGSKEIMDNYNSTTATLLNIILYLIPLFALCIGSIAIAGENEDGNMGLLNTYSVSPLTIVLGKYTGLAAAFFSAAGISFAIPAVLMFFVGMIGSIRIYLILILGSILLMIVYIAVAVLIGFLFQSRVKAIGASLLVWFLSVIVYEPLTIIICLLIPGKAVIPILTASILVNPADAIRFISIVLMGSESVFGAEMYPLISFVRSSSGALFMVMLVAVYILTPLALAYLSLRRRRR